MSQAQSYSQSGIWGLTASQPASPIEEASALQTEWCQNTENNRAGRQADHGTEGSRCLTQEAPASMQKAKELHGSQIVRSTFWLNTSWLIGWSTGDYYSDLMVPELVGSEPEL